MRHLLPSPAYRRQDRNRFPGNAEAGEEYVLPCRFMSPPTRPGDVTPGPVREHLADHPEACGVALSPGRRRQTTSCNSGYDTP